LTYIIIALVVALALAPLTHFLPSKLQRRQAALREAAALKGLFVEFRSLPSAGSAAERLPKSGIIYYGLRLRPSRGRTQRGGAWLREEGAWRSLGARLPVPAPLEQLPPVVLAASVDEVSCGVYWREEGDKQTVEAIHGALSAWAGLLHS
jgi:hypothetical protein